MISKSLTLMALLLCAILAQTVVAKPKAEDTDSEDDADEGSDEEGADDDDTEDEDEEEEEPIYPSLSCILFENIGCNSECSVLGSAFGYKATGTCDTEDDICDCSIDRDDSLDSLWKAKFDSKDILRDIKKKDALSDQVQNILDDPFRTAQEIKDELKSVLSKEQYKNLKLNDDSAAAKMVKKGKLDSSAIKKYVSDKFPKTLKVSDKKNLSAVKYKPILLAALSKAKKESDSDETDAFDELVLDVRRTKNKSLGDILTEYLKKNKFKEPGDERESNIADIITDYVIDELVKKVDEKKPTAGKSAKTAKKAPTKKPQQTKSKKSSKDDDDDDKTSDVALQKNRFVLKNINKSVFKQSGQINQNLNQYGYSLQYQKSWGGNINVVWIKGADEARLQRSAGNNINQNWKFGDVAITISVSAGNNVNQNWNFGKSSYQYSRSPGGSINSNWSNGKPDSKKLKMYKGFIDAWCRDNDFLMAREHCVIYNM